MQDFNVQIHGRRLGAGTKLFLIAGPCVVESREVMFRAAESLAELGRKLGLVCIYKSSYLKANRSSPHSAEGPGLEPGLELLAQVKSGFGLPVCTDIHESAQAEVAARVADVLQIPAFLSRQTDLIRAAAATGKIVNIKKGQFMSPKLACLAAEKARLAGEGGVFLTERGSFFGYNDLVVDFRSLGIMAASGWPVVFDATHSVQQPGGAGESSGASREHIGLLARSAVAAGVDGLFFEMHPEPGQALSDRQSMLSCAEALELIPKLAGLADYVRERNFLDRA